MRAINAPLATQTARSMTPTSSTATIAKYRLNAMASLAKGAGSGLALAETSAPPTSALDGGSGVVIPYWHLPGLQPWLVRPEISERKMRALLG